MLKDLIGCPAILARLRKMDILTVGQNLALSAIQGPNENYFVLAPSAVRPSHSLRNGFIVSDAKLERHTLFRETEFLGSVLLSVVHLVRSERRRHFR